MLLTVSELLFLICSRKVGITEPLEPITLPNLTIVKLIFFIFEQDEKKYPTIISPNFLVYPRILLGLTALSELIKTKFLNWIT